MSKIEWQYGSDNTAAVLAVKSDAAGDPGTDDYNGTPPAGACIYNSSDNKLYVYNGTAWLATAVLT